MAADPLHAEPAEYDRQARRVLDFRDKEHGGVIKSMDDLKGVVPDAVLNALKQAFYTSDFGVRSADIVGPAGGRPAKETGYAGGAVFR